MSVNDGTGENWVETDPANSLPAGGGALEIRDLRTGLRLRIKKEHSEPGDDTAGGEHKLGSARVYYQVDAPTKLPDGVTNLDGGDYGRLWIDANDNLYVWNADETFHRVYGKTADDSITANMLQASIVSVLKMAVNARVISFTYTGGTNPKTLEFFVVPTLVVIFARGGSVAATLSFAFHNDTGISVVGQAPVLASCSWSGTQMTIATTNNAVNGVGLTYTVIAFG